MVWFADRHDAGIRLAQLLKSYSRQDGVVYALPRGGVPVGVEVARALHMPLELVITRKIGHPYNPEYAICAISESGELICNDRERKQVPDDWLNQRVEEERSEARRRRQFYRHGANSPATGKIAIVVDDGIATGLTMMAAVHELRKQAPAQLIVAVPVAPDEVTAQLRHEADVVLTLDEGEFFRGAVGAYYHDFGQLSDEEVMEELHSIRTPSEKSHE